jgi:hypothetical protein
MTRTQALVPTANGAKYLIQLCKHWAHKLQVELSERRGVVRFQTAIAVFDAADDTLQVTLEAEPDEMARMQGVIATHLDRFAFREAPLRFDWRAAA